MYSRQRHHLCFRSLHSWQALLFYPAAASCSRRACRGAVALALPAHNLATLTRTACCCTAQTKTFRARSQPASSRHKTCQPCRPAQKFSQRAHTSHRQPAACRPPHTSCSAHLDSSLLAGLELVPALVDQARVAGSKGHGLKAQLLFAGDRDCQVGRRSQLPRG